MSNRSEKLIIFNSCLILVIGLFSIDMYNPSLPAMVKSLGITQTTAKALAVAYLCGFGVSQLFYGPISDYIGRRITILISVFLAVIGNLLTSHATSGWELLFFRLITGIGAGGCPVISRAILRDVFSDKRALAHAFSIFAMSSQLSPGIAPILGGFIEEIYSWQVNFIALAILTLAVFFILYFTLPETLSNNKSKISIHDIVRNYLALFKEQKFMAYSIISAVIFAYTIGYYSISPFVFQQEFGLSPSANGLLYVFYALGIVLGSYSNKRFLLKYIQQEALVLLSSIGILIITILMLISSFISPNLYIFIISTSLIAYLCGIAAPLLISLSILGFEKMAGMASAVQGMIKMLGSALTLFFILKIHVTGMKDFCRVYLIISGFLILSFLYLFKGSAFGLYFCLSNFREKKAE